jgi:hypothetical protein
MHHVGLRLMGTWHNYISLVTVRVMIINVLDNNFTIWSNRVDQSIIRFNICDTGGFTHFDKIHWLLNTTSLILLLRTMGVLDYWLGSLVYKPC